jgi:hypothetical protein
MIFSENRYPLFGIMRQAASPVAAHVPPDDAFASYHHNRPIEALARPAPQ